MTSILRRVATSTAVLVATAAISFSGTTEAWGKTSNWERIDSTTTTSTTTNGKTSNWERVDPTVASTTAEVTTTTAKTSNWE